MRKVLVFCHVANRHQITTMSALTEFDFVVSQVVQVTDIMYLLSVTYIA